MDVTTIPAVGRRVRRLLLLALFASIAWCVLSIAFSASSASASPGDEPQGSGLLGAVGSTVNNVSGLVADTTGAVDEVLTNTVQSIAPVIEPVIAPLPAPVTAPVADAVETVTQTVGTTVEHVDATVVTVGDSATTAVSEVAQAEVVSGVVEPVTELVAELPVVGSLVGATGLDNALVDVAHGVDGTVEEAVGTTPPLDSILPVLPTGPDDAITDQLTSAGGITVAPLPVLLALLGAPGTSVPVAPSPDALPLAVISGAYTPPSHPTVATEYRTTASVIGEGSFAVPSSASTPDSWPGGGATGFVPGGTTSASSGSGTFGGPAGVTPESARSAVASFSTFHLRTDDALPGAPVFDTDVAPD